MNDQIEEILARLTSDLEVWKSIGERLRVDLFCGLFLKGANEGLTLSPRSLSKLGMRGIELNLDIYSGEEEGTSRAAACR
jgi:hypothetical protein